MSYLVLARKWRPQVFEDVIGQRPITQTLQNAISQKRVAHAFLFTGARGVGKTSTARILAKALNCEKGPAVNPCNQCTNCHEISSGISIDVIEIDGASNRGIDEIRELRETVRYTPAKSRYKIFIIDEVHMLTREAFNALLKTLEEPPPHILFIFATTEPHKIPTTILSRCQRYDFKRIPLKEIIASLRRIVEAEQITLNPRGLAAIARESEGSMRDAQSLLDQVISYAGKEIRDEQILEVLGLVDRKILRDTLEAIASKDAGRCVEIVDQVYQFGYDVQHFCRELLQTLRNLILFKVTPHPETLIESADEEFEGLKEQAGKFQFDQLNHLFSLLLKGEEEIAQSAFPRTMLEMTLIRMATLHPVVPIEQILKKLESLEKGQGPSATGAGGKDRGGSFPPRREEPKKTGWKAEPVCPPEKLSVKASEPPRETAEAEGLPDEAEPEEESPDAKGEVWKELVRFARGRNPILGSFMALGDLVSMNGEQIEIGFEKDSFHYDRMLEPENRKLLERICRDYLKKDTKVVISSLSPGSRPKGREMHAAGGAGAREAESGAERGIGQDPVIQEALRLFDGKIINP
jgi:DNA polymerase-3 subunit gamma/tau